MARLQVRVRPNASKPGITGESEGVWQVGLKASPVEGQANRELLKLLGKSIGVAPSRIEIVSGLKSRSKVIEVGELAGDELLRRLRAVAVG